VTRSEQREQVLIAWTSFTSEALPHTVVRRGDRFVASDPAVKACPQYFVSDDGPGTVLPNERAAITEPPHPSRRLRAVSGGQPREPH
jgi:hypothetical protein